MVWVNNPHIHQGTRQLKLVIDCSKNGPHRPEYRIVDKETGEVIIGVDRVSVDYEQGASIVAPLARVELILNDIEVIPADIPPFEA